MPKPTPIINCTAKREFTDRQEPQRIFLDTLDKEQDYRVLHFYGVGGIGKSALQRHLMSHHLDSMSDTIYSYIDFDNPSNRDKSVALRVLSRRFRNQFKVEFPLFETAYAIYWSRENPHIELGEDRKLPFLDEGSILASAVGLLDGGLTGIAINTIDYIYKKFPKSLDENLKDDLKRLPNLTIDSIKSRLSLYLAKDLQRHIQKHNISKCIILLDTYEALKDDRWIAEELANNLPKESTLTICGREKLRWEEIDSSWGEYIDQHLVGNLSSEDITLFLNGCGIGNTQIVEAIIRGSSGVPYYLDLCVDIYERNPNPKVEDFDIDHSKLFDRFMKYLNQNERETLKVLANSRYFTKELFEKLVEEFKTYYPMTSFYEFCNYSFISQDNGKYRLHNLMRESLIKKSDNELSLAVNRYLLDYYESQFDSLELIELQNIESDSLKKVFEEAYYHKSLILEDISITSSWMNEYVGFFEQGAKYSVVLDTLVDFIYRLEEKNRESLQKELAMNYNNLAVLYKSQGEYSKARLLLEKALDIHQRILEEEHPDTASSYNNLAGLYESQGECSKAEPLYEKALDIRQRLLGEEHPDTAISYNSLAGLYVLQEEDSKAEPLYKKALNINRRVLGEEHPDTAISYNDLAGLYVFQKEYSKAESLHEKALDIRQKVFGEEHPATAQSYNNLALLYQSEKKYTKSELLHEKALDILKRILGEEHPNIATSYYNLAILYYYTQKYQESYEYLKRAIEIWEKVLPSNHPDLQSARDSLTIIEGKII